jgi:hypothetical protein
VGVSRVVAQHLLHRDLDTIALLGRESDPGFVTSSRSRSACAEPVEDLGGVPIGREDRVEGVLVRAVGDDQRRALVETVIARCEGRKV